MDGLHRERTGERIPGALEQHVFRIHGIGLKNSIVADKREFVFQLVILHHSFVYNAFIS
jgi:hypothetical protein